MRAEYAEYGDEITFENVNDISNDGERLFAFACLESGCLVFAQIALGESIIDFFIVNTKRLKSTNNTGKLVEVTQHTKMSVHTPNRLTLEFTSPAKLKHHQIAEMENSGSPYSIIYDAEIKHIKSVSGDPAYKFDPDVVNHKGVNASYRFRKTSN